MARKNLAHKPLIEAILEVRWGPQAPAANLSADPRQKLLLGRLFDRVRESYPAHEPLPTAQLPDEMVPQMVQYRFRSNPGDWPLLQLGPGIFTLNETSKYDWQDFRARAKDAVSKLYEAHPTPNDFKINNLVLRYINAVDYDYRKKDAFVFLRDKMRVSIDLPESLFASDSVSKRPDSFVWQTTFQCLKPRSTLVLKFDTGLREGQPILRWETMVVCSEDELPAMPTGFEEWLTSAHDVLDDWFFKLIEGELHKSFDT